MVCVSWLLAVTLVGVWSPHIRARRLDSDLCKDLCSGDRILNCIHLCKSMVQAESPESRDLAHQSTEDSFSLGVLLTALASDEKHPGPLPEDNSQERRSYSMEHFRWGKPAGRKRRPIKVFASTLEDEDSVEDTIPSQARRQVASIEDGDDDGLEVQGFENQEEAQGWEWFSPKPVPIQGKKKDGTYRMGHFRWGSPPATKRYGGFMRPWVEQSQKPLLTLFKNVIVKDA